MPSLLTFSFRFQFLTYVRFLLSASPHTHSSHPPSTPFHNPNTRIDTKPNFIFVCITCDLCTYTSRFVVCTTSTPGRSIFCHFHFSTTSVRRFSLNTYIRIEQRKTFDTFHSTISRETMFAISFCFTCANQPKGREQCVPRLWRYRPNEVDKKIVYFWKQTICNCDRVNFYSRTKFGVQATWMSRCVVLRTESN